MTPSRILITGAAGFVGGHLLAAARQAFPAAYLIAATRPADLPPQGLPAADETLPFDLLLPDEMPELARVAKPDACLHLAAFADVAASFHDPDAAWAANVDGTRAWAAALRVAAPDCLLLHAGSAEIYGLSFREAISLDEQAPLQPANPYAASKAAIDVALGEMALRGLRVVRMRPLNHIGPGQSTRFAVASFAHQVARIKAGLAPPIVHAGALDRARDFLDVRDVCAAYIAAVQKAENLPRGAIFNLASGKLRSMGAVLADLMRIAGIHADVQTEPASLRPLDIESTSCSAFAARAALDWSPKYAWEATLHDILQDQSLNLSSGLSTPPSA